MKQKSKPANGRGVFAVIPSIWANDLAYISISKRRMNQSIKVDMNAEIGL